MITVEIESNIDKSGGVVTINCDTEGRDELIRQLGFLLRGESHVHLATPSWAGTELGEQSYEVGTALIHQLTIVLPSEEILSASVGGHFNSYVLIIEIGLVDEGTPSETVEIYLDDRALKHLTENVKRLGSGSQEFTMSSEYSESEDLVVNIKRAGNILGSNLRIIFR